jgi:hypothetical protein
MRGKVAIELQPFRNEGKAGVPSICKRAELLTSLDYSQQTGDRGITPPERRQSSCALKRPMDELLSSLVVKRSNTLPSDDRYEETFAPMPSLLQGYASIGTVSSVFFVA